MMNKIIQFLKKTAIINKDGKVDGSLVFSLVVLFILLIQQVSAIFGLTIPVNKEGILGIVNTILYIGLALGIVYDYNGNHNGDDRNGK